MKFSSIIGHVQHKFLIVLIFTATSVMAQQSSPYSRYGLGDMISLQSAVTKGMGNWSAAFQSPYFMNLDNPASFAFLRTTDFETGIYYNASSLSDLNTTYNSDDGNINRLSIGFPLSRGKLDTTDKKKFHWGAGFGMVPTHRVFYNFQENHEDSVIGNYSSLYQGNGTLYQYYLANGLSYTFEGDSTYHDLALGVHTGFMFGQLAYSEALDFVDSLNYFDTRNVNSLSFNELVWHMGFQYRLRFHKNADEGKWNKYEVTVGAFTQLASDHTITFDNVWTRYDDNVLLDTLLFDENADSAARLPMRFGVGFMFEKKRAWRIGADYSFIKWSELAIPLHHDVLNDQWRVALGGGITPDYNGDRYGEKIDYRLGFYYGNSNISINGNTFDEYGLTLGFGLPVFYRKSLQLGMLNFSFELGQRGTTENNLIRENYLRSTLTFTLNDYKWFRKREIE